MPLLNYTTSIDALKTAGEIEYILIKHGASAIMKNCKDGHVESLSFMIGTSIGEIPIKMPVNVEPVLRIMTQQKKKNSNVHATYDQAERVAWRILKDWTEAQMAIIETDMVKIEQVFLPYIVSGSTGKTLFESIEIDNFLLTDGGHE
ncbi:MAG: hypothetical protein ACC608_09510 [Anaerofustis sp.]